MGRVVADDADRHFVAGDELLDQDRLAVVLPELDDRRAEFVRGADQQRLRIALARPLAGRLGDDRVAAARPLRERAGNSAKSPSYVVWRRGERDALGHGDAERFDDAPRHVLVERDGERERVGAGVGDAEHLADGRDAGLARPR